MNGVDFRFIVIKGHVSPPPPPFMSSKNGGLTNINLKSTPFINQYLIDMKGGGGLTCPLIIINIINCLTLGQ